MVELLLSRGADVNLASGAGAPIHAAAMKGRSEIVNRLLAAGADPLARDYEGRTARQAAEAATRPGIAQLFP
jgi:ankyrin repeat protein